MKQLIAYCDGGCRGNPGPSACAWAVYLGDEVAFHGSKYLGNDKTNNYAEYQGLIELLTELNRRKLRRVLIFCDSQLVVNQVNGNWKVNKQELLTQCNFAQGLKILGQHTLQHCDGHSGVVGNELCDQLCNKELDNAKPVS